MEASNSNEDSNRSNIYPDPEITSVNASSSIIDLEGGLSVGPVFADSFADDSESELETPGATTADKTVPMAEAEIAYAESLGALMALEISSSSLTSQQKIDSLSILAKIKAPIAVKVEPNADGKTSLMCAVEANERDLVAWLLDHGADMNAKDTLGRNTLFYAVSNGHADVLRDLVVTRLPRFDPDNSGRTLLEAAAHDIQLVDTLLGGGMDINVRNDQGRTILDIAIAESKLELVQSLINRGAVYDRETSLRLNFNVELNNTLSKNDTRPEGSHPTIRFATLTGPGIKLPILLQLPSPLNSEAGLVDEISLLFSAGGRNPVEQLGSLREAQPHTPFVEIPRSKEDDDRYLALGVACEHLDVPTINRLLEAGAVPGPRSEEQHTAPIIKACSAPQGDFTRHQFLSKSHRAVEALLDSEKLGDIDHEYPNMLPNVISAAALNLDVETVELILEWGSNPYLYDWAGRLPAHFAAASGYENLQFFSSNAPGTLMADDWTQKNTLHYAAQFGHPKAVKLLLDLPCCYETKSKVVNQSDRDGWTPICWAVRGSGTSRSSWSDCEPRDYAETIKILLQNGADVCVQFPRGSESQLDVNSPWTLALAYGASEEILKLLADAIEEATQEKPVWKQVIKKYKLQAHRCAVCLSDIFGRSYQSEKHEAFYLCHKCHQVECDLFSTVQEDGGPAWDFKNTIKLIVGSEFEDCTSESS